ncbi:TonB-dependent siderophore receptor [Aliikangiella sp. G2MR2-5]|uniref:TonB-dependent receptor plug domain-containing protein n=1 Tax=Aliikangiella sp. G2MR2-5 TaxID=2788943 RepID=UPI0018A97BD7|nr:TonB-dependent receptor [Aliikangiella sp. G2MR2-5]
MMLKQKTLSISYRFLFLAFCVVYLCLPAKAEEEEPFQLTQLTLEELLKVTVTTARKTEKPVSKTAAFVTVITKHQIRSSGWRDLSELLNAQVGFYTFSDRIYNFIIPRGHYQSNDPNSRVLLLLNGHSVIESFGYFNGHLPSVDINHIERVEIVRGPGSATYGTNAMFAVINVITHAPLNKDSQNFYFEAGSGEWGKTAFRGDWHLKDGYVSIMGGLSRGEKTSLSLEEYQDSIHPLQGQTIKEANAVKNRNFYFDAKIEDWRVSAYLNHRIKNVPTGIFGGSMDNRFTFFEDTNTFFEFQKESRIAKDNRAIIRVFYDYYEFKGRFYYISDPSSVLGPPYESEFNRVTNTSLGVEVLFDKKISDDIQLLYGAEFKKYGDVDFVYVSENDPLQLLNERFSFDPEESVFSAHASIDYQWNAFWSSVAGLHYDHYQTVGGQFSFRASAVYSPTQRYQLKLLYGESFRAPNSWELNGGFYLVGNQQLLPESVGTYEVLFDYSIKDNWHWISSFYAFETEKTISQSTDGVRFTNGAGVSGKGFESELKYSKGMQSGYLNYSYTKVENDLTGARTSFYPEQQLKLGYTYQFSNQIRFHMESQWTDSRQYANPEVGELPPHQISNLSLTNIQVLPRLTLDISIFNLFDEYYEHPSFTSDLASFYINQDFPVHDIPANGRETLLKLIYQF